MRSLTKPNIVMSVDRTALDALSTHSTGAVRTATSVFVANLRPPSHGTRIDEVTEKLLRGLELLEASQPGISMLVQHSLTSVRLLRYTLTSESLHDSSCDKPTSNWYKQHPVYACLLQIPPDDDVSLAAFAAAYVLGQFTGKSISTMFFKKLVQDSASAGLDSSPVTRRWSADHRYHLDLLGSFAKGTFGEADVDFQRDACASLIWRSKKPGRNDRAGLIHDRCLTSDAFAQAAACLREGLLDAEGHATAIAAGWMSGLTWPLAKRIPLQKPCGDEWVIWLDVTNGCYRVNLSPITRNAATAKGNSNYIATTKEFARNLPSDVSSALRRLVDIKPDASSLGDLTDTNDVPEEHAICGPQKQVLKPSIARFYNSRSSASKLLKLSGPMAAMAIGEMARVPHSRFYYYSTTPRQLDEALARVEKLLGWGSIGGTAEGQAIGACVVPSAETIAAIAQELSGKVLAAQPPRRYCWHHIRDYHNALANYVAFLVGLGLLGRGRHATVVVGAYSSSKTGLVGLHDKITKSSKGSTLVAVCKQVRDQLSSWFKHLKFLINRIDKCGLKLQAIRNRIQLILEDRSPSLVFHINEQGMPVDIGTTTAYSSLSGELQIKADSARHFWEQFFTAEDVDDSLAEAQARRNVRWSDYWNATSSVSGARLRRVIGTLQERVLDELGIHAVKGLTK